MNWIQVLLIAAVVTLLVYLLRSRTNAKAKAWVKIGYVLFVIAAVYAILRPDDTTVIANWLGVDRGTDLLFYALVIAFVFTTLSTYLRFKELELRYARLARAVALDGARTPKDLSPPRSRARARGNTRRCGAHRPRGGRRPANSAPSRLCGHPGMTASDRRVGPERTAVRQVRRSLLPPRSAVSDRWFPRRCRY